MLAFVPKMWFLTSCLFSSLLAFALHFLVFSVGGTKAPSPPVETSFLLMAPFKTYLLGSPPFGLPGHLVTAPLSPLSQSDKVESAGWRDTCLFIIIIITCGLFVSQVLYLFHGLIFPSQTQHYLMRYCHYYPCLTGRETEAWRLSDLVRVIELCPVLSGFH